MEFEKEITVEIDTSLDKLKDILHKNKFQIKEVYDLIDIYMVKKDIDIKDNYLDILKNCVLLRHIIEENKETKQITYKYKEYNDIGEILNQGKVNCRVESIDAAYELLKQLGYNKLIEIKDHISVYASDTCELCVQEVNNKHIYIEIEDKCHYINKNYKTIDEMKNEFEKYNIPIKNNDYFVKKAEIELKEMFNQEI
ncbi:MAG: hypothetical protein IJO32_04840 [Bacilli bacterium]|nr:hypothetical protein [Bacilli bacterium]